MAFGGLGLGGGLLTSPVGLGMGGQGGLSAGHGAGHSGGSGMMEGHGTLYVYGTKDPNRLILESTRQVDCAVASTAFARGACREAFKCRIRSLNPTAQYVAKKYSKPGLNVQEELENEYRQSQIAASFAERFNRYHPPKEVKYIIPHIILEVFGVKYTIEDFMEGVWQKHNNIFGWCESQRCTPATFAHFTYVASGGAMMVLDVQGVGDCYTDPAVCTRDRRFGFTDFGPQGFDEFRKVHKCNEVCRLISLDKWPVGTLPVGPLRPPPPPVGSGGSQPTSDVHGGGHPHGGRPSNSGHHGHRQPALSNPTYSASGGSGKEGRHAITPNATSSLSYPTPVKATKRGNVIVQELYGDVLESSDSIAVCCSLDMAFDEGLLYKFKANLGGMEDLRSSPNRRVGNMVYQTRRTRYIYYLITKPDPSSPTQADQLESALSSLASHMAVNGVTRLSIPRSLGLSECGLRNSQIMECIWDAFNALKDSPEIKISVYSACTSSQPPKAFSGGNGYIRSSSNSDKHDEKLASPSPPKSNGGFSRRGSLPG